MELYRPVSASEYQEIETLQFAGFPPRAKEQPLFTALLSQDGAEDIARHLRTTPCDDCTVYVLSFLVDDAYIRQFPVQNAEEPDRRALWLAADETEILNQHLIGKIRLVKTYRTNPADQDVFFA